MAISIITRAYRSSELSYLVKQLGNIHNIEFEIIAVCNIEDAKFNGVDIVTENTNRFQARATGIKMANFERILLIDSDQLPENDLLLELENTHDDMVIIPERSYNRNFVGKCLDETRSRNFIWAKRGPDPSIPAIPRFYKTEQLKQSVNRISKSVYNIISHEDSILYNEVCKVTTSISFSKRSLYNIDPSFFILLKKAFKYGVSVKNNKNLPINDDIRELLSSLNRNAINFKEQGFTLGQLLQIVRAFAYKMGTIFG